MMSPKNFSRSVMAIGSLGLSMLLVSLPTKAEPCGTELGPRGYFVLTADVGPCNDPNNPALRIIGDAKVNLNGKTVSCLGNTTGIEVEGKRAKVYNGTVQNCEDGVLVVGAGQHDLRNLTVTWTLDGEGDRGFRIRSGNNTLKQNAVIGFPGEGFRVDYNGEGKNARNLLSHNTALNNSGHGFRLRRGDKNRMISNLAAGNGEEGFRIGTDGNVLRYNTSTCNNDDGYRAKDANYNLLVDNVAANNGNGLDSRGEPVEEGGFKVDGDEDFSDRNRLKRNTATGNFDYGFSIKKGNNNFLTRNRADANGTLENPDPHKIEIIGDGILIYDDAQDNKIIYNSALGNTGYDLEDESGGCVKNTWSDNTFNTRLPDCIQ